MSATMGLFVHYNIHLSLTTFCYLWTFGRLLSGGKIWWLVTSELLFMQRKLLHWLMDMRCDIGQKPVFVSRSADGYLTTGCWSPTRPGVIYIGLIDGTMEVWDLLDHSHQPSMVVSVGSCQLTSIEFWKDSCKSLPWMMSSLAKRMTPDLLSSSENWQHHNL